MKPNLIKKLLLSLMLWNFILNAVYCVLASNLAIEEVKENYKLGEVVNVLEEYIDEIDLTEISEGLIKGEGLKTEKILDVLTNNIFKEIKYELKTFVSLLIVIILLAVIKCFELEKGSLEQVVNIIGVLIISSIVLKNYINILGVFKTTVTNIVSITEVISPVILGLLIATGEIITSGMIGPVIMFLTAFSGVIINIVVLPLLNISLVFKIISSISEAVNLNKIGGFLNKTAMWVTSIIFALVFGVLGLETSISSSVDSATVKTTQAAVSNLIPVVGKFVSDSAELIIGASEIIGKTVGVVSIIVILIVLMLPAVKIIIISAMYAFLEAVLETLLKEGKISKLVGEFSKQYKTLAGIMIGVGSVFVITLALAINMFGKAIGG